jgi:hypothetical protein
MPTGRRIDSKVAEKLMLKAGLKPLEPYKGAMAKWKCKCMTCDIIVYPKYNSIQQKKGGCSGCGHKKGGLKQRTDESKVVEYMIKAGLTPLEPYKNSSSKWKCQCIKCGLIVQPTFNNVQRGARCRKCAYLELSKNKTFSNSKAVIFMLENGYQPLEEYKHSSKRWKCVHLNCGDIVYPTFSTIQSGHGGCKKCGYKIARSKIMLEAKDATEIMFKAGFEPLEPYKGANRKWKCQCLKCKKVTFPKYNTAIRGSGCAFCAGKKVDPTDAKKIMVSFGYEPLEPYTHSKVKWKSKHLKCGNIVYPRFNIIQKGTGGCRSCMVTGFDLTKKSYLYLITNRTLGAHKIGIGVQTNRKYKDRLYVHRSLGCEIHRIWNFENGHQIFLIESGVFKIIRKDLKLPYFLSKSEMTQGGYTETIDADSITLLELERIIKKVIKSYKVE